MPSAMVILVFLRIGTYICLSKQSFLRNDAFNCRHICRCRRRQKKEHGCSVHVVSLARAGWFQPLVKPSLSRVSGHVLSLSPSLRPAGELPFGMTVRLTADSSRQEGLSKLVGCSAAAGGGKLHVVADAVNAYNTTWFG